jgi:uncharacterized protein YjaZ
MRQLSVIAAISLLIFSGCGKGSGRIDADVSGVGLAPVCVHRYDADIFKVKQDQLQQGLEALKPAYRFFLDTDLGDQAKLADMQAYLVSPRNLEFHAAVDSQFRQTGGIEQELTGAFKHLLYYYPAYKIPRVYTYISGGDYDFPVQFADSVLLIGLDNFLGKGFKPYIADGLPEYRILRMTPAHIVPECMKVLCRITYPEQLPGNTMLEQMVEAGKRLLFVDAMIPQTEDRFKIGFTQAQYDWVIKNESHVWAAIIANRMLYTTDGQLIRSFMADGPFTAEFSKEAPARLGEWIGWQLVRNYYENQPGVTLQDLMAEKDAQKILSRSGYKPGK